ncbi:hypothetical protein [Micromonospora aurantiaca (nom. illeg.)]|uniref:hypothetical protein n=1 Tax=Micromonospora aurantiaca (nom. illeg.) TaxID=47850 RepID=UPI0033FA77D0
MSLLHDGSGPDQPYDDEALYVADSVALPSQFQTVGELAMSALRMGDVAFSLAALVKLLTWIADLLGDPLQGAAPLARESVGEWVGNDDLRRQLDVEASRLRYSSVRIIKLRELIAAEEISRFRRLGGVADSGRDPG